MLVVTGASGHVGGHLSRELTARGLEHRVLTHDPSRLEVADGVEVVRGGYGDREALDRLLQAGDRVFMVSLHAGPATRVPLHQAFIAAAAERRVEHVTYLSFVAAGPDAVFLHARSHGATEALLAESGLSWAAVRNSMYADDIPGWFDAEGVNRSPGGEGRMSFSDRRELAQAIAVTLIESGHRGVFNVTTPQSVSMAELAEITTRICGRELVYRPNDDVWWEERWRAAGKDEWEIEAGLTSFAALREGEFDVVGGDYLALTGREPASIEQIIGRESTRLWGAPPTPQA